MDNAKKLVTLSSIALVTLGLVTLALNLISNGTMNISWPLVVIMLGLIFFILVGALSKKWAWMVFLYLPGSLLVALGLVFLLNVITADWNAWAYAWMLVVAGLGLGIVLINRQMHWREFITMIGFGLVIGGVTLFVLFGALAGGRFILVAAPILLVLGGIALRWLHPETVLPERLLKRLRPAGANPATVPLPPPDQAALAEPLSIRELEVLGLIDQGLSNPQIAEKLTVAPSTVKTHINNIYGKLGVQTRLQAVKKAKDLGLI
jgi:DNA-binding CsgD family transcriptional regulator